MDPSLYPSINERFASFCYPKRIPPFYNNRAVFPTTNYPSMGSVSTFYGIQANGEDFAFESDPLLQKAIGDYVDFDSFMTRHRSSRQYECFVPPGEVAYEGGNRFMQVFPDGPKQNIPNVDMRHEISYARSWDCRNHPYVFQWA